VPDLVSVVVPVFNGRAHLPEMLESVTQQTHHALDIVLVDGGSTDGSARWLDSCDDPRVRVIHRPQGTGAASNWTAACQQARGAFVKVLCQDDLLHPLAIERQLSDLQSHPSAVMAVARRDIVDARGQTLLRRQGGAHLRMGEIRGDDAIRAAYLTGTNVLGEPLAVLFRYEPLMACLPWNDMDPLMLDLEMYARVARGRAIVVRNDSVGAFRVSTSSWSTRLAREQVRQFSNWQQTYADTAVPPPTWIERVRANTGVRLRAALRRGAYRWLAVRGSLQSPPPASATALDDAQAPEH